MYRIPRTRCIGLGHKVKDATEDSGNCPSAEVNSDMLFVQWRDRGAFGVAAKDTGPLIGITGAFAGILGSVECDRAEVRSAAEGTFQEYTVSFTGNRKMP